MRTLSSAQIRSIPKVELHRHLDCSMRWSTLCELAQHAGLDVPTNPALRREAFLITEPMLNLETVLKKFIASQKVLSSEEILTRLAYEVCEDAFNDGVLILELRYAPTFIAQDHPHLTFEKIHISLLRGLEMARKKWPMAIGLIGIIQRTLPLKEASLVMDFIIDHKETFVGVDLADNEENFDPKPFAPLFARARKENLRVTIHSGETPNTRSAQWVQDSIELLGAERIGHGVQIVRDLKVLNFVRTQKIPLEVCLWSNYLTQAFPKLEDHPLKQLWNSGVLISLGADDPGIFDSKLSDDYDIAQRVHGLNLSDLTRSNDISATSSFISFEQKQKVWPRPILKEF